MFPAVETAKCKVVEKSIILLGLSYNAGKQRLLKTIWGKLKGVVFSIFLVIFNMVMSIPSLIPIAFWSCCFKQK